MESVKLTPEQLEKLRIALIVSAYQEAVEEHSIAQQAWYRQAWPDLTERFDRVHVVLAEIKRAREAREQQ